MKATVFKNIGSFYKASFNKENFVIYINRSTNLHLKDRSYFYKVGNELIVQTYKLFKKLYESPNLQ